MPKTIILLGKNWRKYPSREDKKIYLSLESKINSLAARRLILDKGIEEIIISAGKTAGKDWPSEASEMKKYMTNLPLNSQYYGKTKIILEETSVDTAQNAEEVKKLLKDPSQEYFLVSNSFHLPRATRLFKNYGINVTPLSSEEVLYGSNKHIDTFLDKYMHSFRYYSEKGKEVFILRPFSLIDRKGKLLRFLTKRIRK